MGRFDVDEEEYATGVAAMDAKTLPEVANRKAVGVVIRAINVAVKAGKKHVPAGKLAKAIWKWRDATQDKNGKARTDLIGLFGRVESQAGLTSKVRSVLKSGVPTGLGLPDHDEKDDKKGVTIEHIDDEWLDERGIDPDEVYWAPPKKHPGKQAKAPSDN